jgi:hypothetical protein
MPELETAEEPEPSRLTAAKSRFDTALKNLETHSRPLSNDANAYNRGDGLRGLFITAAVELLLAGLDEWLAAAAKDRESASKDREAAAADRADQARSRRMMNCLTVAIMLSAVASGAGTLWSAYSARRAPAPIVVPAPVVSVAASPVPTINVLPAPVTPNPPAARVRPGRREPR